jgi:uncharacterized protein (TIGR04255 family)
MANENPTFENPPVVEVVCGVQYGGGERWRTVHFGSFWERVRSVYSVIEDHMPLDRMRFGKVQSQDLKLSLLPVPPLRRVFFIQPPGNFLIQLQPNRIVHNWRKLKGTDEYPRYPLAYEKFRGAWEDLRQFARSYDLGELEPEGYELTYINHVNNDGARFPRDLWNFLSFYQSAPVANTVKENAHVAMQFGWSLPDGLGTLTFDLKHGVNAANENDVLVIELSAQGSAGQTPMDAWFDVAHRAIVRTFADFTTQSAHTLWRKQ